MTTKDKAALDGLAELEQDWLGWLVTLFPEYITAPFGPHQKVFWEWVWAITPGVRPAPFIGIWPRGHTKSTSVELAIIALGAMGRRRYSVLVCHAKDTSIFDPGRPDLGWHLVQDHPSASVHRRPGYAVSLRGFPAAFDERVTAEHRYWARRMATRQKKGVGQQTWLSPPHWIEAQHLDWNTYIGYPIDTTISRDFPMVTRYNYSTKTYDAEPFLPFADADFWWVVGLWWGDGTLDGRNRGAISWCCADAHPDVKERLLKILRLHGYNPVESRPLAEKMSVIRISDMRLSRWLLQWKRGRSRKEPPAWVERLPYEYQQELITGYIAADGNIDGRGIHLVSIHLPGLLAVRRILARLGVTCSISQTRSAQAQVQFPHGRSYPVAACYSLHIERAEDLGYAATHTHRANSLRTSFIADGFLWTRVRDVGPCGEIEAVPIQTDSHTYLTAFGRSHNCESQEQADNHVATVASMMESVGIEMFYPDISSRALTKYGQARGWRRNRLHTRSGFIVDALGLDVASRGLKVEEQRPDLIIFDDIDTETDQPGTVKRKISTLTRRVLPLGTPHTAIVGVQNLVHADSVFAQLADDRADFLADRVMSGPIPALEDINYEVRTIDGRPRTILTGGTPTWGGMDIQACQNEVDTYGITAFLSELQHVMPDPTGGMWDDVVFRHCARDDVPDLDKVVCWVDPAVTDSDDADSMGIQIDGIARDATLYRLWSWEHRSTPQRAIEKAIRMALEFGAVHVGIETDQGGQTWRSVFNEARTNVGSSADHLKMRSARAGSGHGPKVHRASQMLTDYELGKVVHVMGTHDILERALRRFPRAKPFDLVDAAYWGWYDLRRLSRPATTSSPAKRDRRPAASPRRRLRIVS